MAFAAIIHATVGTLIVVALIRLVKRGGKAWSLVAAALLVLVLVVGVDNRASAETAAECARMQQTLAKTKERVEAVRQQQEIAYQNAPARSKAAAQQARDRFYTTWYYPRLEQLKAEEAALTMRCAPRNGQYDAYQRGFDGNTLQPTRRVSLMRTQQGYLLTTPDGRYTLVPGANGQFATQGANPPVSVQFVRQNNSTLGTDVYDVYFRQSGRVLLSETWSLR